MQFISIYPKQHQLNLKRLYAENIIEQYDLQPESS